MSHGPDRPVVQQLVGTAAPLRHRRRVRVGMAAARAGALGALLGLACAAGNSAVAQPACARLELPRQAQAGALVQGCAPPGTAVRLQGRSLRIAEDGRFVFGIGRDAAGPLLLEVEAPQGTRDHRIEVQARNWRIERVDGLPQQTVTPDPAIAARIAAEQARVVAARKRDDARLDFAAGFQRPLHGRISGVYGSQRVLNGTPRSPHMGLDIAAPTGTPVAAPAAGVVSFADADLYLTGGTVLLDHGHGLSSSFLHLSRIDVEAGQQVARGDTIGAVGATGRASGPHLHWGVNWFDVRLDPALLVPDEASLPQKPR